MGAYSTSRRTPSPPTVAVCEAMTSSARRVHTVHYPSTDHMGEDFLQRAIAEALRPLIARWFKSRRVKAFTGADQFLYWV
jgi:hypothetical protein